MILAGAAARAAAVSAHGRGGNVPTDPYEAFIYLSGMAFMVVLVLMMIWILESGQD